MSEPTVLYVPGIKPKPPAAEHRAALWRCLLEGVRRVDGTTAAAMERNGESFQVVSWAHVFYETQRDIGLDRPGIERLLALRGPEERDLREAVSSSRRLKRALYKLSDAFPPLFAVVANAEMRATLQDTQRYFSNDGGAAVKVRQIVADALIAAWSGGHRVLLAGHSLGSVIALDVLWELSHRFAVPGRVDLLLTLGSPLGLSFVREQLLGAGDSGRRRYPANVRRWINLAATGEMTALDHRLAEAWAEMRELGLIESIVDRLDLQTWFRGPEGLNVHKCYGYMVNPVVAGTIAGWWREQ